jgi:hypothetical protein
MANGASTRRRALAPPAPSPPPPHDPRERVCVAGWNGWEVRSFAANDRRRGYLASHGMGHVQLWHPGAGVSVLTPSRLTGDQIEIYPIAGWKRAATDTQAASALVRYAFQLTLPGPARLHAFARWSAGATQSNANAPQRPATKKVVK